MYIWRGGYNQCQTNSMALLVERIFTCIWASTRGARTAISCTGSVDAIYAFSRAAQGREKEEYYCAWSTGRPLTSNLLFFPCRDRKCVFRIIAFISRILIFLSKPHTRIRSLNCFSLADTGVSEGATWCLRGWDTSNCCCLTSPKSHVDA